MSDGSPALAFWQAIAALIEAAPPPAPGPEFSPLLQSPRYYYGAAEPAEDAAGGESWPEPGYFIFGQSAEDAAGYYGRPGEASEFVVHCWAHTLPDALRLYKWLKALLTSAPLAVAGYAVGDLNIRKGRESPDPEGGAWQCPLYCSAELLEAA